MKLFQKKETVIDQRPKDVPAQFFAEVSQASSPLYEGYNFRPYNPDALYNKAGNYTLYDEMREDDQINSLLTMKKIMILGKWEIRTENDDVKEFLEWSLQNAIDGLFEKKLFNMLSALDYGFSFTEKIFGLAETPMGTKIILKNLKTRAPHSFTFYQDDKGNIIKVEQDISKGQDIKLNPKKFIHLIHQGEFDNPYGKSEMNVGVYRAWFSKENIIKFWNIYLERFGMPTHVGTYPKSASKDKAQLLKVLKNIQAKTGIALPEGFDIKLLESRGFSTQGGYAEAIDKYNTMIARKMLYPDLMGFSGGEIKGGSFALGQEHFQIFFKVIEQERTQLAKLLNKEIIDKLVFWNFGKDAEATINFVEADDDIRSDQYTKWLEAVKTGKLPSNTEQWNHFLRGIEFPELEENTIENEKEEKKRVEEEDRKRKSEEAKNRPIIPIPAQAGNMPNNPKKDRTEAKDKDKAMSDDGGYEKAIKKYHDKILGKDYTVNFFRELSDAEKRVDFQRIDKDVRQIEDDNKDDLAKLFKLGINGLMDEIKREKIIEKKRFDKVNKLELGNQARITKKISEMVKESFALGTATAKVELAKHNFVVDIPKGLDDKDIAKWIKNYAFFVSDAEAGFILGKVKPTIMSAIVDGLGVKETMKLVDETLKGYDMAVDSPKIEQIVRTTTAKGFNEGRMQEFEKAGDEIGAFTFSAILDNRTSPICNALDGKTFTKAKSDEFTPPLHPNCRSILVPEFSDEDFKISTDVPAVENVGGDFLKLKKEK